MVRTGEGAAAAVGPTRALDERVVTERMTHALGGEKGQVFLLTWCKRISL